MSRQDGLEDEQAGRCVFGQHTIADLNLSRSHGGRRWCGRAFRPRSRLSGASPRPRPAPDRDVWHAHGSGIRGLGLRLARLEDIPELVGPPLLPRVGLGPETLPGQCAQDRQNTVVGLRHLGDWRCRWSGCRFPDPVARPGCAGGLGRGGLDHELSLLGGNLGHAGDIDDVAVRSRHGHGSVCRDGAGLGHPTDRRSGGVRGQAKIHLRESGRGAGCQIVRRRRKTRQSSRVRCPARRDI